MDEPTPPSEGEQANEQRNQYDAKRWAMGIVTVFALCCAAPSVWFFTSLDGDDDDDSPGSRRFDAERVCTEEFVPDRLRAPSTAEFSGVVVDVAGETYTVTGDVDSQNGFGAMIRSRFHCTVRLDGDSWQEQSATVR